MRGLFFILIFFTSKPLWAQVDIADTAYTSDPIFAKQQNAIGKELPSFSVTIDAETWNNERLKGKTVFLNLWFEACPPCIVEMDALNELYEKLKDSAGFLFLSITFDSEEQVKRNRKKYNIRYPVISLTEEVCRRLNHGLGFPANIILSRQGKIVNIHAGGVMDKAGAREFVMSMFYPEIIAELKRGKRKKK